MESINDLIHSKSKKIVNHVELKINIKEHLKRSKSVEIKIEIENPRLSKRVTSAPNVNIESQNVNF